MAQRTPMTRRRLRWRLEDGRRRVSGWSAAPDGGALELRPATALEPDRAVLPVMDHHQRARGQRQRRAWRHDRLGDRDRIGDQREARGRRDKAAGGAVVAALTEDPDTTPECVVLDEFSDGLSDVSPHFADPPGYRPFPCKREKQGRSFERGVWVGGLADARADRRLFVEAQQHHAELLVERPQHEHLGGETGDPAGLQVDHADNEPALERLARIVRDLGRRALDPELGAEVDGQLPRGDARLGEILNRDDAADAHVDGVEGTDVDHVPPLLWLFRRCRPRGGRPPPDGAGWVAPELPAESVAHGESLDAAGGGVADVAGVVLVVGVVVVVGSVVAPGVVEGGVADAEVVSVEVVLGSELAAGVVVDDVVAGLVAVSLVSVQVATGVVVAVGVVVVAGSTVAAVWVWVRPGSALVLVVDFVPGLVSVVAVCLSGLTRALCADAEELVLAVLCEWVAGWCWVTIRWVGGVDAGVETAAPAAEAAW